MLPMERESNDMSNEGGPELSLGVAQTGLGAFPPLLVVSHRERRASQPMHEWAPNFGQQKCNCSLCVLGCV